jgi:Domain of unknown function (DUF4190)
MTDPFAPPPGVTPPSAPDPTVNAPTGPVYVDPITGAPVYLDPATGQYMYAPPDYSPPAGYPQPGPGQNPYYLVNYAGPGKTNAMAIAALAVSIAGGVLCGFLGGVIGAILGHVARRQIAERGEDGAGMALAAIIIGWTISAVTALLLVFAVVVTYTGNN